jgi:DNA repair protein RadA/Sms
MAVASTFLNRPLGPDTVVFGEVGLSSEVRSVAHIALRLNEAEKLGFKRCIVPRNNLKGRKDLKPGKMEIIPVAHVKEALDHLSR